MMISTNSRSALYTVLWALVAVMGSLWATLGHPIGWLAFISGIAAVFYSSKKPLQSKAVGDGVYLAAITVGIIAALMIILDMAGVVNIF